MENLISFKIAAGAVFEVNPGMDTARTVEVNVLEGGPVYAFPGRVDATSAVKRYAEGDFQFGASGTGKAAITTEARYGSFTLFAPNAEAIGYVRVSDKGA